jgi:hypothetical protein
VQLQRGNAFARNFGVPQMVALVLVGSGGYEDLWPGHCGRSRKSRYGIDFGYGQTGQPKEATIGPWPASEAPCRMNCKSSSNPSPAVRRHPTLGRSSGRPLLECHVLAACTPEAP